MTTAIVGVGNIGGAVARHLVTGVESVVLAAKDQSRAQALAEELGPLARAASVEDAIDGADAVVLAVWLDAMRELIPEYEHVLKDKVVIDPSNPIGFDPSGQMMRTLPDGESAGSLVAGLLPQGAHYVKAFGTLGADALAASAHRDPLAVLFYATDDEAAATTIERLIRAAGFEPWKAGGVAAAGRIEAPGGDLHQYGFNGQVVDIDRARSATAGSSA
ncbi:MAG TPA: NAD(P)-binding domain-containing protein [Streptosporangiaceae bacterium]|nr:NAD(P)-binding domain-containing protein [Streptosporangiaceae bacterium]